MGAHAIDRLSGTLVTGGRIEVNREPDAMLDLALRVFRVNAAARRVLEVRPERAEVLRVLGEISTVEGEVEALAPSVDQRDSAQMIYGWVTTLERARRSLEALRSR